jgi:tetratricopeptide (TPR) repeat protein
MPRARELNSLNGVMLANVYSLYTHYAGGDAPKMVEAGRATAEAAERSGDLMGVWVGSWMGAYGLCLLGDHEAAERLAGKARALFDKFGGKLFRGDWYVAAESTRLLAAGRAAEALSTAQEAMSLARARRDLFGEALALRASAEALAALDPSRWEQIERELAESARLLEACEAKLDLARTYRSWGVACRSRGAEAEAIAHFQRAAAQFEESEALFDLERVRALLS